MFSVRLLEEEDAKRKEEERLVAEAAAAELMDDEDALNEAEAEMLRHLDDLDEAINDATVDEDIGKYWILESTSDSPCIAYRHMRGPTARSNWSGLTFLRLLWLS